MARVYLYSQRDQEVQAQAGLNWGFSNGNVCISDAYIALNAEFLRDHPGFFPVGISEITVTWDDGREMLCLLEGTQRIDGVVYPKQISSVGDKSILGEYLRGRIGVSNTHQITRHDLRNYGREEIEIIPNGGSNYTFDFSR